MSDTSAASEGAFSAEGRQPMSEPAPPPADPVPALKSIEKPRPQSLWQRLGIAVMAAAIVAALVACVVSVGVHFLLGGPGGRDPRMVQEGKVQVNVNGEREVFYAEPFAGPPHLELEAAGGGMNFIKIKEQKADHFTIHPAPLPVDLRWRAEGMRLKK